MRVASRPRNTPRGYAVVIGREGRDTAPFSSTPHAYTPEGEALTTATNSGSCCGTPFVVTNSLRLRSFK